MQVKKGDTISLLYGVGKFTETGSMLVIVTVGERGKWGVTAQ